MASAVTELVVQTALTRVLAGRLEECLMPQRAQQTSIINGSCFYVFIFHFYLLIRSRFAFTKRRMNALLYRFVEKRLAFKHSLEKIALWDKILRYSDTLDLVK